MSKKTIDLAMIVKNERKNLPRLFESVKDCFTAIHVTDTGSTDGTIEWLNTEASKIANCQVYVHHFEWVNSFCKARNYSFSKCTSDFIMWIDADDCLHNREDFIKWRDTAMEFNGAWFATYHYALDINKKPLISFMRERVFRRNLNPTWQYDIHEGVVIDPSWNANYATTWAINHMRDLEDIKQDKSRNISILEKMPNKDARMQFYYGKELYEANRPQEAIKVFEVALKEESLQAHDRVLSLQYGAYAATKCFDQIKDEYREEKSAYLKKALDFCSEGLKLDPNRAEFHVAMGDLYVMNKEPIKAIPCFAAAKSSINSKPVNSPYEGAVYSMLDCYGEKPSVQLIRIYFTIGLLDKAKKEALECIALYQNDEAKELLNHIEMVSSKTDPSKADTETEDIVFTCPPQQAYEFDEEIYKTKGMGGSETALIHMAKNLKKKTGRRVIVFNQRERDLVSESGVEYLSNTKVTEYFSKHKPKAHIAWRHNIKITNAKTYLWCHDLTTRTVESFHNFDKILCLSQFHKDYVESMQGVPSEKIIVTRNGVDAQKFGVPRKDKNPNKVVWMSSPDRGLEQCMLVMDELRHEFPELELHVYYGLDNLIKYGMADLANKLKSMMAQRLWVKYHGFTEQKKMYTEVSDAVMWLHPCNFIETFCITALEMLELGIYPVTRSLGALKNTLNDAWLKGDAIMLDHPCDTEEQIDAYAAAAAHVLRNKSWEKMTFDVSKHDWSRVADEWADFMEVAQLPKGIE